jgi:uncharacterized protein (DUF433 family)
VFFRVICVAGHCRQGPEAEPPRRPLHKRGPLLHAPESINHFSLVRIRLAQISGQMVPAIIELETLTVAKRKQQLARRMTGRFIVADPAICHGQPTFRGTRVMVADVLEQVAAGIAWETIAEEYRGDVSADSISEAVRLASQAFRDHSAEYTAGNHAVRAVAAIHRVSARAMVSLN